MQNEEYMNIYIFIIGNGSGEPENVVTVCCSSVRVYVVSYIQHKISMWEYDSIWGVGRLGEADEPDGVVSWVLHSYT